MIRDVVQRDPSRRFVCTGGTFGVIGIVELRRLDVSAYLKPELRRIGFRLEDLDRVRYGRTQPGGGLR
jgi:hypothetical protein